MTPQQKQLAEAFKQKPSDEQCNMIADFCNQNNISQEQFKNLLNMFIK
jgi:hypothetical protein